MALTRLILEHVDDGKCTVAYISDGSTTAVTFQAVLLMLLCRLPHYCVHHVRQPGFGTM